MKDLEVEFNTSRGIATAVNGMNFEVKRGQALGILGESGSGKSVTARAIMGILDMPPAHIPRGQILLEGEDLLTVTPKRHRQLVGSRVSMVFQDALTALNPVHPVGRQIGELYRVHRGYSRRDAKAAAITMMERVKIPAAAKRVNDYPHQFSGGMRQRIVIAMALALDPVLLIADEPTTALDVTVQAQILELLKEQQEERNMGLILITHDISVVKEVTDQVAVMYAGPRRGTRAHRRGAGPPRPPLLQGPGRVDRRRGTQGPAPAGDPRHAPGPVAPAGRAARSRTAAPTPPMTASNRFPPWKPSRHGRFAACFHTQEVLNRVNA